MRSASARWRCGTTSTSIHEPEIGDDRDRRAERCHQGPGGPLWLGVLYIEKEGFDPIIEAAGIPERFDIAPMSCKGMSVTAGAHAGRGTVRAARPASCTSCTTSTSPASRSRRRCTPADRRYTFKHKVEAVDLGLRLADIEWFAEQRARRSPPRRVDFGKGARTRSGRGCASTARPKPRSTSCYRRRQHRPAGRTQRHDPDQFVAFVERKLTEHGAAKVIPSPETLAETFAAFKRGEMAKAGARSRTGAPQRRAGRRPRRSRRAGARLSRRQSQGETWDDAVRAIMEAER